MKEDIMTVREMIEILGLAAGKEAAEKLTAYNLMLMEMNQKVNLTVIESYIFLTRL